MDRRIRFPGAVWRLAAGKAGDDRALDAKIVAYVTQYATGTSGQAMGGRASMAGLTDEERREKAQRAARARWGTR